MRWHGDRAAASGVTVLTNILGHPIICDAAARGRSASVLTVQNSLRPAADSPTGPRAHASGRTEQLFGIRRHAAMPERDGALNPAAFEAGPWCLDLDGRPTGAAATVIMDNATAVAVHHAAPGVETVVTTELQINVLAPLPAFDAAAITEGRAEGPLLECWTRPLSWDAGGGVGRAWLEDAEGRRIVEATGWFQAVPTGAPEHRAAFTAAADLPRGPETRVPMPGLLAARPETLPPADRAVRPAVTAAVAPGARFAPKPELANPSGAVHGGAMTLRAVVAAQAAMPDRELYDVQAVRVVFTRPGHGEMVALTRVRHAGRSLRLVDVDLVPVGEDGAPVAEKPMVQVQVTFRAAR